MRILVVGGGGREHGLVWSLARSGHKVVCAPGNPGIAATAECLELSVDDLDGLEAAAVDHADLVVVGPEVPLVAGLADRLRARGVPVFGPGKTGAQLEGSKVFCKQFFARHGIRTAEFFVCETAEQADRAITALGQLSGKPGDVVVKADGLAAGKGVVVCSSEEQARAAARDILGGQFGDAGQRLVIERRIRGHELSVMALCDGKRVELLAQAEDHKSIFDGDRGPNTGGMGAISPAPWATPELIDQVRSEVFAPTLAGLQSDRIDFRGVLYAGIMVDADGTPWMLEYNCRFGDPETQPVLSRLTSDLGEWLYAAATGALPDGTLEWDPRTAVCVVLASAGYPASSQKGVAIRGVDAAEADSDVVVFHAGTAMSGDKLVTAGGRVLGVTALADSVAEARQRAYQAVARIQFAGMQHRTDIGARTQG